MAELGLEPRSCPTPRFTPQSHSFHSIGHKREVEIIRKYYLVMKKALTTQSSIARLLYGVKIELWKSRNENCLMPGTQRISME